MEATTLTNMTKPVLHEDVRGGESLKLELPFVNVNFRANVRVVDFYPSQLEDFACPNRRRAGEYDMLSDKDESELDGSDDDTDMVIDSNEPVDWTWHFYVKVEDALVPEGQTPCTAWVCVDNEAAQMLLGEDASDLRHDERGLAIMRNQLFLLWGNLEDYKASIEKRVLAARSLNHLRPPAHSDDEEDAAKAQPRVTAVSNREFGCCIRQYGVKVREDDDTKASAGDGWRWQRMFGLFGTKICSQ